MERLEGLHRADAAIAGGGLTGLLLASSLAHEGLKVAVIDAADGFSGSEWAAASLLEPPFAQIRAIRGGDAAAQYARSLQRELQELHAAPAAYMREMPGYLYAMSAEKRPQLEQLAPLLAELGLPVSIAPDAGGCPFPVELSLTLHGQSVVNIHRWKAALQGAIRRQGGQVYAGSRVISLEGQRIFTEQGCIQAGRIILTAGIPPGIHSRRMLSMLESRTHVWCDLNALIPLHSLQFPLAEHAPTLIPQPAGLLAISDVGRSGTRAAEARIRRFQRTLSAQLPDHIQVETGVVRKLLPLDGLPLIGMLPGSSMLMAAGVCGPLGAMHAARLLTRRIMGRTQPEDMFYAPDRHIPGRILRPAILRNTARYAAGLLRPGAPECSLCGCRMRYLSAVSRWECPYCGSAFTMLGQVIVGPAVHPAQLSVRQRPDL